MALNKIKKHKYKQENKMVLKKCWSIKSAPFKINFKSALDRKMFNDKIPL